MNKKQAPAQLLSERLYAKSRKERGLPGGSHTAVRKAIASGRLVRSVTMNAKGKPVIDPAIADREWDSKTDPAQQRAPSVGAPSKQPGLFGPEEPRPGEGAGSDDLVLRIRKAQADKIRFDALLRELTFRNTAGQLAEVATVEREVRELVEGVMKELRSIPDRICGHVASINDAHRCKLVIASAIDQACREFVEGRLQLVESK